MKFGEYLQNNLTSEWYSQYIAYEDLKEFLTEVVNKAPVLMQTNQRLTRQQYFRLADEEFFRVNKYIYYMFQIFISMFFLNFISILEM